MIFDDDEVELELLDDDVLEIIDYDELDELDYVDTVEVEVEVVLLGLVTDELELTDEVNDEKDLVSRIMLQIMVEVEVEQFKHKTVIDEMVVNE